MQALNSPGKPVKDPIQDEKLQRRANNLAACLKVFLGAYQSALQQAAAAGAAKGKNKGTAAAGNGGKAGKAGKANSKQAAAKSAADSKSGKGGKAAKDPKTEAWATLLYDLDDRINKSKKCNLEDLYRAVGTLDVFQKQALSNIIATTTAKQLPEKQNEASIVIKDTLFAAAAAHSYSHQQVPNAATTSAAAFREAGLPADTALESGFRVGQLLRAGYSTAELVRSSSPELGHLRAAGVIVKDLYSNIDPAQADSLTGPAGAARLKAAGYPVTAVQAGAEGKISMWDLKLAGYALATANSNGSGGADRAAAAEFAAGPPKTPRLGLLAGSANSSSSGTTAGVVLPGNSSASGARARDAGRTSATGAAVTGKADGQLQQTAGGALEADGQWDVEYFRHQIKPLMHMQAGSDLPDLLIGTKDKLVLAGKVNAVDEPAPAVMLAPNPVKMAQQRKKSGTGSLHISVPSSAGSQSHMGPLSTRGGPMGAKTLDRSRLRSVTGEQ
eukprot:GHUV01009086.1.p1 GENE.GHUV01009086.1~~GHUV01009086.1.p1  ORF type:complete len:500 (+),score=187.40 GHUV01009086.1:197-1696(+)